MKKLFFVLAALLLVNPSVIMAQGVSYNHDSPVMNQFTVGETGVGSLTPSTYYWLLHNSYRKSASVRNKLAYRTTMNMFALRNEIKPAESIDSVLKERAKAEALTIADRTPGVTDFAWQAEKHKVETKLALFKENIESITLEGGTPAQYKEWLLRYNAISCGIQAIRDAYMPMSKRHEQYVAIYRDIERQNRDLTGLIMQFRYNKKVREMDKNAKKPQLSKKVVAAQSGLGRWKVSMASASHLGK